MINDGFPNVYSTFEQQAMMAFSMNSDQLPSYGGMVGASHDEAVKRAAQAALEVFQSYDDFDFSFTPMKEEIPIEEYEIEPEEEIEEDLVIQTVKGRFMCPRPNCSKLYKNRNGLKYHLQKGSCRLPPGGYVDGSPKGITIHSNDPDEIKKMKPFWCKKCSKRYKNLNGLKYHGRVEHPELEFERIRGQTKD